ncbi:MAG: hypothetical protein WAK51_05100, partial [Opitutaceae bacterium]
ARRCIKFPRPNRCQWKKTPDFPQMVLVCGHHHPKAVGPQNSPDLIYRPRREDAQNQSERRILEWQSAVQRIRPNKKKIRATPCCPGQGALRDIHSDTKTSSLRGLSDLTQKESITAANVQNAIPGIKLGAMGRNGPRKLQERRQPMYTNPRLNHSLIVADLLIVVPPMKKAQITLF